MPELPEVETVRKGLAKQLLGGAIENIDLRREGLRFPLPQELKERLVVTNHVLVVVERSIRNVA